MAQATGEHMSSELEAAVVEVETVKNKGQIQDQLLEKTKENKRASSELVVLYVTSACHDNNFCSSYNPVVKIAQGDEAGTSG